MGFLNTLFGGANNTPGLQNTTQSLLNSLPQQQALGTANTTTGLNTLQGGVSQLQQAGNYFNTILNGSQTNTEKQIMPEVNTVLKQYDSALNAGQALGPRGGGRSSAIESAKTGKAGAYGNILAGAQGDAAKGLMGVGKDTTAAGAAAAGIGTAETGQAAGQAGSLAGTSARSNDNMFGNSSAFGSAIGSLFG